MIYYKLRNSTALFLFFFKIILLFMIDFKKIADILIHWYNFNKRDLPWRKTDDPYKIWVSEIILQQTRVNQGINYYIHFIEKFPDIQTLANAETNDIMKIWQGLGYYSRARNMQIAAIQIMHDFGGEFPKEYLNILRLKGIGNYTAAAIASIAFNEPVPVIDGNVYRVLARFNGIFSPIGFKRNYLIFFSIAESMMGNHLPGTFNQAIMELGAVICTPRKPHCSICPINKKCYARIKGKIDVLPVKIQKAKTSKRYFNYLVITGGSKIFVKKRIENDIWKLLYDFPLIETDMEFDIEMLLKLPEIKNTGIVNKKYYVYCSETYIHKLTHQTILAKFFRFELRKKQLKNVVEFEIIEIFNLRKIPLPRLMEKFIKNEFGFTK